MPSRGGYAAAASALLALSSVSSFGKSSSLDGLLWGYSNAWLGVNEEVCVCGSIGGENCVGIELGRQ